MALIAALLASCGGYHGVRTVPVEELVKRTEQSNGKAYTFQIGDIVAVKFYFNPELDYDTQVRSDGAISLSLIGDLPAAGHTTQELSTAITTAYKAFLNQPNATVILRSPTGHRVFVTGEVLQPGVFTLQGNETALSALSFAGGLSDRATYKQIVLIRRLPGDSQPMVSVLNLKHALDGRDPRQDVRMCLNDIVYVPRTGSAETDVRLKNLIWGKGPFSITGNATYNGTIK